MIERYLRRQDGVITLMQARRAGLSEHAVRRRVRSRQWRRCSAGIYFADDRPFTTAARIRAAVWGHGSHAVAGGLAAAWWLGLTSVEPEIVDVTVPRNSHGRSTTGTRVRRRDLIDEDIWEHRDLRTTGLALTVLEAAAHPRGGAAIIDSALQRRLRLEDLQRAHRRNGRRHGSAAASRLLASAAGGARSEAERLVVQLLRTSGLSGWRVNFPVGRYLVDIAFPEQRIAIEIDGWAFHSDHDSFQRDRRRQNTLALHGWQVLRFTWLDITGSPQRVLAEISAAVLAR